jgi:hypothetical protein
MSSTELLTTNPPSKLKSAETEAPTGTSSRRACPRTTQGKFISFAYKNRWAVYDLEWKSKEGRNISKLVFIMYSPDDNQDNAEKFVIACNKDLVKSKVSEINLDWQVNRWDDLLEEKIIAKFD